LAGSEILSPGLAVSHLISTDPSIGRMGRRQATLRVSSAFDSEFSLVVAKAARRSACQLFYLRS
jgi:hypothetical protein